eukprot:5384304-Prymnesium_polylepis.1
MYADIRCVCECSWILASIHGYPWRISVGTGIRGYWPVPTDIRPVSTDIRGYPWTDIRGYYPWNGYRISVDTIRGYWPVPVSTNRP